MVPDPTPARSTESVNVGVELTSKVAVQLRGPSIVT